MLRSMIYYNFINSYYLFINISYLLFIFFYLISKLVDHDARGLYYDDGGRAVRLVIHLVRLGEIFDRFLGGNFCKLSKKIIPSDCY